MDQEHLYLSYAREDAADARHLYEEFLHEGVPTFLDTEAIFDAAEWDREIAEAIARASMVAVLISPNTTHSQSVIQEVNLAYQYQRPITPMIIRPVASLPWFVQGLQAVDLTTRREHQLRRFVAQYLRQSGSTMTFGQAMDAYLYRGSLKSSHTIDSYRRAIELFLLFLADRSPRWKLPIQQAGYPLPAEIPLSALSDQDVPLFLHFAQWLLPPGSSAPGDNRPYKPSTIELRLAGLQNWFQFMDDYGWLPSDFKLAKARRMVRDELRGRPRRSGPPQPPEHIEDVIYFYDNQPLPDSLRKPEADPNRIARWELIRARNRALLHTLAETGGRISEILSLNVNDFPVRHLTRSEVLRIEVQGKGGHTYYLRLLNALPAIHAYLELRGSNYKASRGGQVPLFVSHYATYDGSRMSRVVAWRVVHYAARAVGIHDVTPHDFRHWRATQLINAGHALDVVQEYLGHRSVETTRAYYAHTDPLRVDDAARRTGLPPQED